MGAMTLARDVVRCAVGASVEAPPAREGRLAAAEAAARVRRAEWVFGVGTVALCSLAMIPFRPTLMLRESALVYLLGIVLVASRTSRSPALAATILSVAAFDFLFVPPVNFFSFVNPRHLFTDAVMFAVGYITSRLTLRIREQAAAAIQRERQTATLYSLSRELAGNSGTDLLGAIAVRHVEQVVPARAALLLLEPAAPLGTPPGAAAEEGPDAAAMRRALETGETAGRGTTGYPDADALYLPLRTAHGTLGVLRLTPLADAPLLDGTRMSLLEAFTPQIAMALERAALAEKARRAALKAEREAMRSTLLSSISHDLRTPLASIVGAATALQQGNGLLAPAARGELLQTIAEESEHLDAIVRNVLALTQLESVMAPLKTELQSVEELVAAAVDRLGPRLDGRALDIAIPEDLPLVPCDPILIGLVVTNFLENALRHTPPASRLEIAALDDGVAVRVELRDRGPGIDPGDEERIFEKFTRGRGHSGGLGLGLAICRAIVLAHGGSISAANRPGGGAVFSFTLPTEPRGGERRA